MYTTNINLIYERHGQRKSLPRDAIDDGVEAPDLDIAHSEGFGARQPGVAEGLRPVRAPAEEVGVQHKGEALAAAAHAHPLVTAEHEEVVGLRPSEHLELFLLIYSV